MTPPTADSRARELLAHKGDPCQYCLASHDTVPIGPCKDHPARLLAVRLLVQSGLYQRAAVWPTEPSLIEAAVKIAAALREELATVTADLETQRLATYQAVEREHAAKKLLAAVTQERDEAMTSRRVIEEADLKQFQANMQRIKVGGGVVVSTKIGDIIRAAQKPASPYRSKWEAAYASKLELEKQAGVIRAFWYEPFSLWLPGKVRYKPDFMVQYPDGMERRLEIKEIKGWSRNRRDGITRLKIAAALFPCFRWILVVKDRNGWDETEV